MLSRWLYFTLFLLYFILQLLSCGYNHLSLLKCCFHWWLFADIALIAIFLVLFSIFDNVILLLSDLLCCFFVFIFLAFAVVFMSDYFCCTVDITNTVTSVTVLIVLLMLLLFSWSYLHFLILLLFPQYCWHLLILATFPDSADVFWY